MGRVCDFSDRDEGRNGREGGWLFVDVEEKGKWEGGEVGKRLAKERGMEFVAGEELDFFWPVFGLL